MKPSIFIGSSSEALELAKAIRSELARHYQVTLWTNAFSLGSDTLSELLRNSQYHDFALLVLTEDDETTSRQETQASPRDNVIFELGLFMGAMGRNRAYAVIAKSSKGRLKIPSDLAGSTFLSLPEDLHKTLEPKQLADCLQTLSLRIKGQLKLFRLQLLPSTATAIGYYLNFVKPVGEKLAGEYNGHFKLNIVLPKTLKDASKEGAKVFAKEKSLEPCSVEILHRQSHFFKSPQPDDDGPVFYDYPTTLHSSYEAIKTLLQVPRDVGETEEHIRLGEKEIRNFRKTLEYKLNEPEAATFRDHIHITRSGKRGSSGRTLSAPG